MQNYFTKIKGSALKAAQQGLNLINQTIHNNASNVTTDVSISKRHNHHNKPDEELVIYFQEVCEIIDTIAESEHPYSIEADRLLYSSKAKDNLQLIVSLLQQESDRWYIKYSHSPDPEMTDLPCLDTFIQTHVLHTLCNRASRDLPRGTLPLILGIISSLLRSVRYPLLPHQTVHKPIAHLISIAWRFEAFHGEVNRSSSQSPNDIANYRKRIGK